MILLRWTIRLIGLVSTIILARLLTPADFGVVSIAMIVVAMLEVLSQSGQKLALIRIREPTREDYDSVWTISFFTGLAIAIAILLIAPYTKAYFHEPRSVVVMQCLALRALMSGMENVGIVDFRRDIQFDRFFRYNAYPKVFSFSVTIGLAWYLRNYWALVAGILSGQLATIVLSYVMHPFRPRFSLARVSHLWSFSTWTLVKSIGVYVNSRVDQIVIGGIAGAPAMGRYAVAIDVSESATREINDPVIAVLYPVIAKLQGNLKEVQALYLRALSWSAIICASASVGVCLVAPEMVYLILGNKWLDVAPLMPWLALSAGLSGLSSSAYAVFDVTGKAYLGARMQWVRIFFALVAIVPVGLITHNLVHIAQARLAVTVIFLPTLFFTSGSLIGLKPRDFLTALWRPFVAAALMALAVGSANFALPIEGILKLAFDVAAGVVVFSGSLFLLWLLSGRPAAPERDILGLIRGFWLQNSPAH